jgi:hypothetical protein
MAQTLGPRFVRNLQRAAAVRDRAATARMAGGDSPHSVPRLVSRRRPLCP